MRKFSFFSLWLIISLLIFSRCKEEPEASDPPVDLKVEYQSGEVFIDDQQPRFTWLFNDNRRNAMQSAYQVLVASSKEQIDQNAGDLWDSGQQSNDQSHLIAYNGQPLQSGKQYWWKVRTWDQEGNASDYSQPASFRTGLMKSDDWSAQWIGNGATGKPPRSIMLRKNFQVRDEIKEATAYVTGLGSYVLFINGEKAGDARLTPGWTHYPEKLQYQAYDVSDLVKNGENAVGAMLGNMWWSSGLGWKGGTSYSEGPLKLLMQLDIEYQNGTRETIISDESWKVSNSPVIENTIYHGEKYDARMVEEGWNTTAYNDSTWAAVQKIETPDLKLVLQQAPLIRVTQELAPVNITEPKENVYVFDFGQNMVGGIRLQAKGPEGNQIVLKYAELLHEDGTVAQENLRSAEATDVYIMKGEGFEKWEPEFTYHGFRYVQVEGYPNEPVKNSLTGLVFHNDAPVTGFFETSNQMINQINKNITWGQRGNMHSVPTDCPQRDERLGWMGDAQIFAPTSCYNMNMARFYSKWVRDIADGQDPEGWVYDVNPPIVVEGPASPGWGDAITVVPYVVNTFYGDLRIVAENYEPMKKWVEYMAGKSEDYIYHYQRGDHLGYGDWIAPVKSPQKPISAAYFFWSTKLLSEMAAQLGKENDALKYEELSKNIATAFNNMYFDEAANSYEGGTQTANLIPVAFGITPPNKRAAVIESVVKDIENRGVHPTTGFLGTNILLPTLCEYGHDELAYQLATQTTYPSWGYMISKGATTMWELWNSDSEPPEGMNSRNHFALGAIGEWFYGYLAGIRPVRNNPGFKEILFEPHPLGDLNSAQANYVSPYGNVLIKWERSEEKYVLELMVPANTEATVKVPTLTYQNPKISESGNVLYNNQKPGSQQDIVFAGTEDDRVIFKIGAGSYQFEVTPEDS